MISEHGELSLVFAVQVCVFCSATGTRPSELPAEALLLRAVSWTRPPVPTDQPSTGLLPQGPRPAWPCVRAFTTAEWEINWKKKIDSTSVGLTNLLLSKMEKKKSVL